MVVVMTVPRREHHIGIVDGDRQRSRSVVKASLSHGNQRSAVSHTIEPALGETYR